MVENFLIIVYCTALLGVILASLAYANLRGYWRSQSATYLCTGAGMAIFFLLLGRLMVTASAERSVKALALRSLSALTPDSQLAIYNTYVPGLIFYLGLDRPIRVVAREGKEAWMGSPYISKQRPNLASGYGKVLFTFDEFAAVWKERNNLYSFSPKRSIFPF